MKITCYHRKYSAKYQCEFIPYFFDEITWAPNKFLNLSLRVLWTLRVGSNRIIVHEYKVSLKY